MKSAPNVFPRSRCGKRSCVEEDIVEWDNFANLGELYHTSLVCYVSSDCPMIEIVLIVDRSHLLHQSITFRRPGSVEHCEDLLKGN